MNISAMSMRVLSAVIPLVFIAIGTVFYPGSYEYWTFILITTISLGYIHFFIGTAYQLESIQKKSNRRVLNGVFGLIALGAFLFAYAMIQAGLEVILGIFTIIYFVTHELLNEKTFLQAQLQLHVPYYYILSFLLLIVPPFLLAIAHPSFFYDFSLKFGTPGSLDYEQAVAGFVAHQTLYILCVVALALFTVAVPYITLRKFGKKMALLVLSLGLLVMAIIVARVPIHFVYLLHFVLVFHFILLFFIFLQFFYKKNQASLNRYLVLHGWVTGSILVLITASFMFGEGSIAQILYSVVFDFGNFLTVSLMHVSVSLLNESWFVKLLRLQQ